VRDPKLLDLEAAKRTLAGHGLAVPAIGTGQAYSGEGISLTDPRKEIRQAALQRLRDHVELAREFDALVIIGLIRGKAGGGAAPHIQGWLREGLAACSEVAVEKGVRLVVEPINRYETTLINTADEALALIEEVGLRNTGVLFDTFHANIEEASLEESIRRCAGRLYHVHVADSNRRAPGDGHLDFSGVFQALRDVGYGGFLSAEILPLPDPDTSVRRTFAYLKRLLG